MRALLRITLGATVMCQSLAHATTGSYVRAFPVQASPEGLSKPERLFELRFVVDQATKKAYLMGNAGSSEVEIIPNTDGVTFVEITKSGNVMVTAIAANGTAVHNRNGIMFKELIPSQYYGKCTRQ